MRIEDVEELREEADRLIRRELIQLATAEGGSPWRCPPALGICSVGENDYQLAIRIRNENEIPRNSIDTLRERATRANSDINLKVVGTIGLLQLGLTRDECRQHKRPVFPGLSISQAEHNSAGTLGCFVCKKGKQDLFLLSCAHVIALPANEFGVSIIQPGQLDGGNSGSHRIAVLEEMSNPTPHSINQIDAAIARVISKDGIDPVSIHGVERLNGFHRDFKGNPKEVIKTGRTTGTTLGEVTAFEMDVTLHGQGEDTGMAFHRQIEISGKPGSNFVLPGDSGSLVIDKEGRAIGLVFAASTAYNVAYANPIEFVFDHFSIDFPKND